MPISNNTAVAFTMGLGIGMFLGTFGTIIISFLLTW